MKRAIAGIVITMFVLTQTGISYALRTQSVAEAIGKNGGLETDLAVSAKAAGEPYFPGIEKTRFGGPNSTNPFEFKWYNKDQIIGGKRMEEIIRPTVAYWHTFKGTSADQFGDATQKRHWTQGDNTTNEGRMQIARQTMDAAFEFYVKIGATHWTFHDRDIAPEAYDEKGNIDVVLTEKNLQEMVEYAKKKQEETGVKLLWGTANVFFNPRFRSGAGSSPNFDVLAHAGAQIRAAMRATMELGGENYVFWGGREGYSTLHNTFMGLEKKHIAILLKMAVKYNEELAKEFRRKKLQLLIEPKPQEPTQAQYDSDVGAVIGFLYQNGLEKDIKLNPEAGHAILGNRTFRDQLESAVDAGMFATVDINRGDPNAGWDTDQFPGVSECMELMLPLLAQGGFTTGGCNFDAKVRRESTDTNDIVLGHIKGMDALARALIIVYRLYTESPYLKMRQDRYASFQTGEGQSFEREELTLDDLREHAIKVGEPVVQSGKEEKIEALVEQFANMSGMPKSKMSLSGVAKLASSTTASSSSRTIFVLTNQSISGNIAQEIRSKGGRRIGARDEIVPIFVTSSDDISAALRNLQNLGVADRILIYVPGAPDLLKSISKAATDVHIQTKNLPEDRSLWAQALQDV